MSGFKGQIKTNAVCAGTWRTSGFLAQCLFTSLISLTLISTLAGRAGAVGSVSVQISTSAASGSALQADLLTSLTTQYLSTVNPTPFFPGSYTAILYGKNPNYQPPVASTQSTCDVQKIMDNLVAISTTNYEAVRATSWADGTENERWANLNLIKNLEANCTSYSTFLIPAIDTTTCHGVFDKLENDIYTLFFATPTVMPGN